MTTTYPMESDIPCTHCNALDNNCPDDVIMTSFKKDPVKIKHQMGGVNIYQ